MCFKYKKTEMCNVAEMHVVHDSDLPTDFSISVHKRSTKIHHLSDKASHVIRT